MAIQFRCVGCGQPIEVDDELADQQVTCPFCKSAQTVPSESTLEASSPPPPAEEPAGPPSSAPAPPPAGGWQPPATPPAPGVAPVEPPPLGPNPAGTWSLICAALSVLLLVAVCVFTSRMLRPVFEDIDAQPGSPEWQQEYQKRVATVTQERPDLAGAMAISSMAWFAVSLLALVLSIVGLTRTGQRRKGALAALLILVGSTIFGCCGGVLYISSVVGM